MRKFLIISHGKLADGLKQTLSLFIGESNKFDSICAYVDDTPLEEVLFTYMRSIGEDDELIVLSDIEGGSVNQKIIPYLSSKNMHIIAGFNLATAIQLSTIPDDTKITEEVIEQVINETITAVSYVNNSFNQILSNEEDE
ncbi:MAG: hypothetical protein RR571_08740 [Anaerorhabdus sp.]